jgi:hypothetical protein
VAQTLQIKQEFLGRTNRLFRFYVILVSDRTSRKKSNTIWEAVVLVLMMGVVYEVHR